MNKIDLETLLPEIQKRYSEVTDEAKRLEGEFRAVQGLIGRWIETKPEEQKGDKAVDAQTNPTTS